MKNVKKSVAVIGEGETEWFYIEALRLAKRYTFKLAPDFPQHGDIPHVKKLVDKCIERGYDFVVCLIDMDRLQNNKTEKAKYVQFCKEYTKKKYGGRVVILETNPCTEFWFLLHFLPNVTKKVYSSQNEVINELKKYLPGYEKTKRYFINSQFLNSLFIEENLSRAMQNSEALYNSIDWDMHYNIAYSQIHQLFAILNNLNNEQDIHGKRKQKGAGGLI